MVRYVLPAVTNADCSLGASAAPIGAIGAKDLPSNAMVIAILQIPRKMKETMTAMRTRVTSMMQKTLMARSLSRGGYRLSQLEFYLEMLLQLK